MPKTLQTATELYPSFLPEAVNVTEGTGSFQRSVQNNPIAMVHLPESLGQVAGDQLHSVLGSTAGEGRGVGECMEEHARSLWELAV